MQVIDPEITVQTAQNLGLTEEEFEKIKQILNRSPNFVELYIFSVMWSEAVSRKNALLWLKTLPGEGSKVNMHQHIKGVDIGDGYDCILKMTNDNHAKADQNEIDLTKGMDGAIRELYVAKAQRLATMQSLKLGAFNQPDLPATIKNLTANIGSYSKDKGIPIIGGATFFHKSYDQQNIINTLSAGILKSDTEPRSPELSPGYPIFIIYINKAETPSIVAPEPISNNQTAIESTNNQQLSTESNNSEFTKISAITKAEEVLSFHPITKGGIVNAVVTLCQRNTLGAKIKVEAIPHYDRDTEIGELLSSHHEEQFLLVSKNEELSSITELLDNLQVDCQQIGEFTNTEKLVIDTEAGQIVEIPTEMLAIGGGAPVYERAMTRPKHLKESHKYSIKKIKSQKNWVHAAEKLFSSPNLVSKRWIKKQYALQIEDQAPSDAAIIPIPDTERALALTLDGNANYVNADPYTGGMIAIAEAARNIVCSGGKPLAIAHGLNYGDPHNPEVYWQFVNTIKGMTDAIRKFRTPVINGDISFYNQSKSEEAIIPIYPSPTIGMVGLLESVELQTTLDFKEPGDIIYMIGNAYNDLNSSAYLKIVHEVQYSPAPKFDLHEEFEIQQHIKTMIRDHLIESAHDVSEGGLFMCLMESAMERSLGFNIETVETFRKDAFLFGESQSRIVVSLSPDKEDALLNYLISSNVSFSRLGEIFGNEIIIDNKNFGDIQKWKELHENALSLVLDRDE